MPHPIPDEVFPQVNPTGATSANRMDIRTSPNMFGGSLAQAEELLGQGVEKVGERHGEQLVGGSLDTFEVTQESGPRPEPGGAFR